MLSQLLTWITMFFLSNKNSGYILAHVAQMVKHSHGKGKVSGSSPVIGSLERKNDWIWLEPNKSRILL